LRCQTLTGIAISFGCQHGACATVGVVTGAWDQRILLWLAGFEDSSCAVIAGLITRAHVAGLAAGHLSPGDLAAVLDALDVAADYKRDRAACCGDCDAPPDGGSCTTCEWQIARADGYDALAAKRPGARAGRQQPPCRCCYGFGDLAYTFDGKSWSPVAPALSSTSGYQDPGLSLVSCASSAFFAVTSGNGALRAGSSRLVGATGVSSGQAAYGLT
jgi:hypothetical protein